MIKGLKGAAFIYSNTLWISLGALAVWAVVMTILDRMGIGVPLAGLSSWQAWSGSGLDPTAMTMEALQEPVRGNTLILLGAGAVMVATLWFSSKARSVTQTEVNLGRQDEGHERFTPGPVSRGIVRTSLADRAWGRDAAVYRLAGVFSVLGGWLVTAAAAFLMAATFAVLIKSFGAYAVAALVAAAVFGLVHTHRDHAQRSKMDELISAASPDVMDRDALTLRTQFVRSLEQDAAVVDKVLAALVNRKRKAPKKLQVLLREDMIATRESESEFVRRLNVAKPRIEPWLMSQLDVLACDRDLLQSLTTLVELTTEHILNEHSPPTTEVADSLLNLRSLFADGFRDLAGAPPGRRRPGPQLKGIQAELDRLTELILEDLYAGRASTKNTTIMLGVVLELRDVNRELERAAAW